MYDDRARDLSEVLRSGHKKGGKYERVGDDGNVKQYDVDKPMILSGISDGAHFWDVLEAPDKNRCIRVTGLKADPEALGLAEVGTRTFETERATVMDTLDEWASVAAVDQWAAVPHAKQLDVRQKDTWRPLVAMAAAAGGPWPDRVAACIEWSLGGDDIKPIPRRIVADTLKVCQDDPLLSRETNPAGLSVRLLTDGY
ncbi:MAG TPA: DUF3631 domain-containing protein [Streptosporangiaceae bacterium]|nr:DUF3631 domain-containing protein [Streptosporangiaceae bacterium]